ERREHQASARARRRREVGTGRDRHPIRQGQSPNPERREHWWRTQTGGTIRRGRRCSTEPRVDSADQLRISLGEVNVRDPAAAGEQIEGKLSWIEAGIARHVLEIARAFERRLLEA